MVCVIPYTFLFTIPHSIQILMPYLSFYNPDSSAFIQISFHFILILISFRTLLSLFHLAHPAAALLAWGDV